MVAPERQRQGLGEVLFRMWDRNVGASLGLGLSDASYRLFQKLRWPDVGPVPCFVKPLTRRALRRPNWPVGVNRLVSALTLPVIKVVARTRPLAAEVRMIQRFDESFTELWNELAPKFDLAVRRDAAYLNWKYVERAARPLFDCGAPPRQPQRRLRGLPALHRAARTGDASSSTSSPTPPTSKASRRCCAGSIARRGRPTPTRSGPSPCTPASAGSFAAPATSPSSRRWSSSSRSTACRWIRRSTSGPTPGT